jgi:hypothetical protein
MGGSEVIHAPSCHPCFPDTMRFPRRLLCHSVPPRGSAPPQAQSHRAKEPPTETLSQNKPFHLLNCLPWVFCHSNGKPITSGIIAEIKVARIWVTADEY